MPKFKEIFSEWKTHIGFSKPIIQAALVIEEEEK